ncbi:MAG: helix-turn-helix transcriptional regulator [Novosphingobium sp.]|nr:helix-turn-helix transcriptional regulator [Novosphingobium sp.]
MTVGDRIKERLGVVGISQAELARRVRLDQSTINGLVRGAARGSRYLHQIARELRTTSAYLNGETDDPTADIPDIGYSAEEREWVDLIRSLPPKDRSALMQLARTIAGSALSSSVHSEQSTYKSEV